MSRARNLFVVIAVVLVMSLGANIVMASHYWYGTQSGYLHQADMNDSIVTSYGDWMGNESYRAAFRSRMTDATPVSMAWPAAIINQTSPGESRACRYEYPYGVPASEYPQPQNYLRVGIPEVCVGDWANYFAANPDIQDNARGVTQVWTSHYSTGGRHIVTSRVMVDSGRTNTDSLRRRIMCHEGGHTLGLGHNPDTASCMSNNHSGTSLPDAPVYHDHQMLETIYLSHNDPYNNGP